MSRRAGRLVVGATPRHCGGVFSARLVCTGKGPLLLPTVFLSFIGGGQASRWKAAPPLQIPVIHQRGPPGGCGAFTTTALNSCPYGNPERKAILGNASWQSIFSTYDCSPVNITHIFLVFWLLCGLQNESGSALGFRLPASLNWSYKEERRGGIF